MTRYLEVGSEIAQRVRSGELPGGAELWSVRDAAREYATTTSTVHRAYRYLAEGGVITLADRRRARVATDGALAAARLLEADRVFRLAGSDDPALQIVLDHIGPAVTAVGTRGSFQGVFARLRGAPQTERPSTFATSTDLQRSIRDCVAAPPAPASLTALET